MRRDWVEGQWVDDNPQHFWTCSTPHGFDLGTSNSRYSFVFSRLLFYMVFIVIVFARIVSREA